MHSALLRSARELTPRRAEGRRRRGEGHFFQQTRPLRVGNAILPNKLRRRRSFVPRTSYLVLSPRPWPGLSPFAAVASIRRSSGRFLEP